MIEKDAYSLVSEILRPESFYEHRHQLIYSAITDLAVNQKPVDILTVKEQLSKRGELEEVGGPFYITQLSSKVASSAHIEYHARIIAQKALARELITFTSNIQSKAFDETLADAGRTLGLSNTYIFWRVRMPCCRQGILAGTVLAFARALGEYGATSMLAGYTPGKSATVSTAVYQLWQTNNDGLAMKWVVVNLAISAVVLLAVNMLERRYFLVSGGKRRGTA